MISLSSTHCSAPSAWPLRGNVTNYRFFVILAEAGHFLHILWHLLHRLVWFFFYFLCFFRFNRVHLWYSVFFAFFIFLLLATPNKPKGSSLFQYWRKKSPKPRFSNLTKKSWKALLWLWKLNTSPNYQGMCSRAFSKKSKIEWKCDF